MEFFTDSWLFTLLQIIGVLLVVAVVIGVFAVVVMYIQDVTQTSQTVRRNYPVIGRFRYRFEHMGEFFRQYFFAMDREELPFNRADRSWVYRAAKNVDSTVAFGSTRDLRPTGSIYFVNTPYPTLGTDAVEPRAVTIGEACEKPFTTSALIHISGMSYGAISVPAIQALSHGAKAAGVWLNTGEGGLSPYHLAGKCDVVFQIGTAKFGVRDQNGALSDDKLREVAACETVRMFELKLSQGAKPGKGGILPGAKVTAEIAAIRGIGEGLDAISPNRHPDIKCAEDLLNMINHIRDVTGKPVGFKTVVGEFAWLEELFSLIDERGHHTAPDFISVDSADGGTGAAPASLMDYMGLPIQESLPQVVDLLDQHNLRPRVRVVASGKLITPSMVAWAISVGADFVVSARGFMFALGCIQALQCNKNTCPTGITTHNLKLQRGLVPSNKSKRVANYIKNISKEVGIISHSCGVREPRELDRHHARIVLESGKSIPYSELYPPQK